jgi:hypothetical protein
MASPRFHRTFPRKNPALLRFFHIRTLYHIFSQWKGWKMDCVTLIDHLLIRSEASLGFSERDLAARSSFLHVKGHLLPVHVTIDD